jgi:hypothetical protein
MRLIFIILLSFWFYEFFNGKQDLLTDPNQILQYCINLKFLPTLIYFIVCYLLFDALPFIIIPKLFDWSIGYFLKKKAQKIKTELDSLKTNEQDNIKKEAKNKIKQLLHKINIKKSITYFSNAINKIKINVYENRIDSATVIFAQAILYCLLVKTNMYVIFLLIGLLLFLQTIKHLIIFSKQVYKTIM